jgi:hypothetical protein
MSTILDDDENNTPENFNECVSQEQLQSVVDNAQKDMKETVFKAITDAFIKLKLVNRPMKTPDTPRMRCMMPMVI